MGSNRIYLTPEAEEDMTIVEWAESKYNTYNIILEMTTYSSCFLKYCSEGFSAGNDISMDANMIITPNTTIVLDAPVQC